MVEKMRGLEHLKVMKEISTMTNLALSMERSRLRYPGLFASRKIHFVGIGGVGMRRLASILLGLGCQVSGSDLDESKCNSMRREGWKVFHGHRTNNLPWETNLVVYSSAVSESNPEIQEALKRGLCVLRRGAVLADLSKLFLSIVVCGSHGKTSTTGLTFAGLRASELSALLYLGGELCNELMPKQVGREDCFVVEADESDRSFLEIKATFPVVTNIDFEHLTAYESFDELKECFIRFLSEKPFYGAAVVCIDDPVVRSILPRITGEVITYGFHEEARIRAVDVLTKDGMTHFQVWHNDRFLCQAKIALPGRHQVQNSLVAFAVGLSLGLNPSRIAEGIASFEGIGRRCEVLGTKHSCVVISDYGHHPAEIATTVDGLRAHYGVDVHVVFQPHRFSRTKSCWKEFCQAFSGCKSVAFLDVYSAGEAPIAGVDSSELARQTQHDSSTYLEQGADISEYIQNLIVQGIVAPRDLIVFMGAGSIDRIGRDFLNE
jgi:UDP-N-acetylmuramate--alanine ligase